MIRFLRAFIWLRWRLLRNGLRTANRRRDVTESLSRLAVVVVPAILGLAFLGGALTLSVLAFACGRMLGRGEIESAVALLPVRLLLLVCFAMLLLAPLGRSMQGAASNSTRLLLLPVPRPVLHRIEVLAGLFDPWMAFVLPPLAALSAGLLWAGRVAAAAGAAVAGACLVTVLAGMASLLSFLAHWLLRDRRRAEATALVFLFLLSFSGVPAFLMAHHAGSARGNAPRATPVPGAERRADRAAREPDGAARLDAFDARLPRWSRLLPSELYARSLRGAVEGNGGRTMLLALALLLEGALLYRASAAVHRRLLDSPATHRARRGAGALRLRVRRLPGLGTRTSAVAFTMARTLLRTVRGRTTVFLTAPMLLVVALMSSRLPDEVRAMPFVPGTGAFLLPFGFMMCLFSLQQLLVNQFAVDRAGVSLQFLLPLSDIDVVRGRIAGGGLLFLAAAIPCILVALPYSSPAHAPIWAVSALGAAAAYLLLAPILVMLSALFPKTSDLSRLGSAGQPHPLAGLIGTLILPFVLGPGIVALLVVGAFGAAAGLLVAASGAVLAAALLPPLMRLAAGVVGRRRENLALVALGR
jgi:hypothetical protein